ncbi:hypothetical protein TNCV_4617561 [Trichonephila clavipes]|nr:hypothetical protein TNCV_4617561 [Trichonephila clavipes]
MKQEMQLFDSTENPSPNFIKLCEALKTIPPTSVEAERAFSAAGFSKWIALKSKKGPNPSASSGFFDFKLNQNVEGVILCDAPCDSVMNANESFLCDSESVVLCDNKSVLHGNESVVLSENQSVVFSGNSDSVVNDMVDCANDYSVEYVQTYIKNTTTTIHDKSRLIIDEENQLILNEVPKKKSQTLSLKRRKEKLRQKCLELINSLKSDKQCDVFDKILKSAPPQLEAIDILNAQEIHFPTANKDIPPIKNIIPQRFSNAKKKRKLSKTSTVTSQNEDNNAILKIILDHKNSTPSPTKKS